MRRELSLTREEEAGDAIYQEYCKSRLQQMMPKPLKLYFEIVLSYIGRFKDQKTKYVGAGSACPRCGSKKFTFFERHCLWASMNGDAGGVKTYLCQKCGWVKQVGWCDD